MKKYVWLFGENLGKTMNNNSYYFWKRVVGIDDEIDKYLVVEKNKKNVSFVNSLDSHDREYIVWKNSLAHYKLYNIADMLFVTLSYNDVLPEKVMGRRLNLKLNKQLVYLQHGTLGIKKLGYKGNSYNNRFFRFCIYNNKIKEIFMEQNDFKEYQIYYAKYHPRYWELIKKSEKKRENNFILWFITWREYFGKNVETEVFVNYIKKVIESNTLTKYLKESNTKIRICVHQEFEKIAYDLFEKYNNQYINIIKQSDTDLMEELAKAKLLITDYSSLGFDFTILNKPVILYQPDRNTYLKNREIYCSTEELKANSVSGTNELIDLIVSNNWSINRFFRDRLPEKIDYDYLKKGNHIIDMYDYFAEKQKKKITFIGYNFYGVGGTVNATLALAEGLLEAGYMVDLISLKASKQTQEIPYGLNRNYLYNKNTKSIVNRLKYKIKERYDIRYFRYDKDREYLHPYIAYKMDRLMENIKSSTVVSTRESIHPWVNACTSSFVNNRVCFFHLTGDLLDLVFPGLKDVLRNMQFEKTLFVTGTNRDSIVRQIGKDNLGESYIIGNSLPQSKMISPDEIRLIEKKDKYSAVFMCRISSDRKQDLLNLINFGKYVKKNGISNIEIDVYGRGDYLNEFLDLVDSENLFNIINYCGFTNDPSEVLKVYDFVIDFSLHQSFGMTYIEAILNGKKVFCMETEGAKEVLKDIDNTFIDSFEDLIDKINHAHETTIEELVSNYHTVWSRYSRMGITDDFLLAVEN